MRKILRNQRYRIMKIYSSMNGSWCGLLTTHTLTHSYSQETPTRKRRIISDSYSDEEQQLNLTRPSKQRGRERERDVETGRRLRRREDDSGTREDRWIQPQ